MSSTVKEHRVPEALRPFKTIEQAENFAQRNRPQGNRGRILQVFLDADLRPGHEGLTALAKQNKIDVNLLQPGQFVVFVNTGKNKLKVFAASGVIAYCRLEKGRSIDLTVIQEIPRVFLGGRLDYDKALKEIVEKKLAEKVQRKTKTEAPQAQAST